MLRFFTLKSLMWAHIDEFELKGLQSMPAREDELIMSIAALFDEMSPVVYAALNYRGGSQVEKNYTVLALDGTRVAAFCMFDMQEDADEDLAPEIVLLAMAGLDQAGRDQFFAKVQERIAYLYGRQGENVEVGIPHPFIMIFPSQADLVEDLNRYGWSFDDERWIDYALNEEMTLQFAHKNDNTILEL